MAARPRTLPAAAAPVLVGTSYAAALGTFRPLTFVATLLGALFIQIGTNLSNDYSDARRGADTEDRNKHSQKTISPAHQGNGSIQPLNALRYVRRLNICGKCARIYTHTAR
jgi:1,4-dihydroxy-2-naphthoate octaprenyltransferase